MVENVILTKEYYVILTNLETTWKKWICDLSPKNALRVNFSTGSLIFLYFLPLGFFNLAS